MCSTSQCVSMPILFGSVGLWVDTLLLVKRFGSRPLEWTICRSKYGVCYYSWVFIINNLWEVQCVGKTSLSVQVFETWLFKYGAFGFTWIGGGKNTEPTFGQFQLGDYILGLFLFLLRICELFLMLLAKNFAKNAKSKWNLEVATNL